MEKGELPVVKRAMAPEWHCSGCVNVAFECLQDCPVTLMKLGGFQCSAESLLKNQCER